jgi:hypothetical protein
MSSLIKTTAKAVDANSYSSLDRADQVLSQRLYADAWITASGIPNADGYLAAGGASIGDATIQVDTGVGVFTKDSYVRFGTASRVYKVTSPLRDSGKLFIEPALEAVVADDALVTRVTMNEREAALVWATRLLDQMMIWNGTKRTNEQVLRWPRSGVLDPDGFFYDYDTIPPLLEEGTAELALVLLESNAFKQPGILGQGVDNVQLGPLRVNIASSERTDVIPQNILSLLSPLGRLEPEAKHGTKMVPLRRV